jgi:hypothetical protein
MEADKKDKTDLPLATELRRLWRAETEALARELAELEEAYEYWNRQQGPPAGKANPQPY